MYRLLFRYCDLNDAQSELRRQVTETECGRKMNLLLRSANLEPSDEQQLELRTLECCDMSASC